MKAPEHIATSRLVLRRPHREDAQSVFDRYASDREATRYMSWPRHESVAQTHAFLDFSDAEWNRWPAGPYIIESREAREILGSTGFGFETPDIAVTGYILTRDAWGRGYATEALSAMCALAPSLGIRQLYALVHADHHASQHVLETCGNNKSGPPFATTFPNLLQSPLVESPPIEFPLPRERGRVREGTISSSPTFRYEKLF